MTSRIYWRNVTFFVDAELVMVKHSSSTRHYEEKEIDDERKHQDERILVDQLDFSSLPTAWFRRNPLWSNLMSKTFDEKYKVRSNFLDAHPAITLKMRSVLCDWLIEVFLFETENSSSSDSNEIFFLILLGLWSLSSPSGNLSFSCCLCWSVSIKYESFS